MDAQPTSNGSNVAGPSALGSGSPLPDDVGRPGNVRAPFVAILLMVWLAVAVVAAAMVWDLRVTRENELDRAELTLQYQVRSLGEHIAAMFDEDEQRLRLLASRPYIADIFANRFSPTFFNELARFRVGVQGALEFRFIDASGQLISTGQEPAFGNGTHFANAPFFLRHTRQFQDFVVTSIPAGPGQVPEFISISRAVYGDGDRFLGVVQLRKRLDDIANFMSTDEFGGFEQAVLFDVERFAMASWPPLPDTVRERRATIEVAYPFQALGGMANQTVNEPDGAGEGQFGFLLSSFKIPSHPFTVAAYRSHADVLRDWSGQSRMVGALNTILIVLALSLSLFVYRSMRLAVARDLAVRKFHSAVDQSTVSILITDLQGRIEYVNPFFTKTTGYTLAEVVGKRPNIFKTGHTPPHEYQHLWQRITSGKTWHGEFLNRKKNGDHYWENATIYPIRDGADLIINYIAVKEDITDRREAEDLIHRQAQRLNEIIWGTNIGTWEWDVQTGQTRFNDRWAEICGYTLDELEPISIKTWLDLCHPKDLKKSERLLNRHFTGQIDYYECEARMRHKDGHWVWVLDRGKVTSWTQDGKPKRMAGTHADITLRKQAEERLRVSENRYRRLVEQTQKEYFIYSHDVEGVFTYVSPSVENVLGYTPEMFQKHYTTYLTDNPINEEAETHTAMSTQGLQSDPYDVEVYHRNGETRVLEISESPVINKDGTVEAVEGIAHDITAQRAAEHELEQRNAELRLNISALNKSWTELETQAVALAELAEKKAQLSDRLAYEVGVKDRFFSIIAHDLKSPFTALLGMTQMMALSAGRWSKEQLTDYAGSVNESANRVFELVQTLLEWARLQMDGTRIDPVRIQVHELTQETVDLAEPTAIDKGINLKNGVSFCEAVADENMVRTILRNLVTNALKFTPSGGDVVVDAKPDPQDPDAKVQISVRDSGVGMTQQQIDDVFRLDVKTTTTGTDGETGTGLGLPLCKEMVELNRGRLWVESTPGEGTTFTFTLNTRADAFDVHGADEGDVASTERR